jgi:hypothetical protein
MHPQPITDNWTCPACGHTTTTAAERARHENGIDAAHLECPHQDIEAIKAEQQRTARRPSFAGMAW